MKKILLSWVLSVLLLSATNAQYGVERTGYEGDYFSLQGAIELFKQSRSINDFERKLNTNDNWVNNLDLDYDGRVDYIRVEHRRQGDFHAIILQVPISRYEVQDVAVIEIEQTGNREAILQIVGDEDLYGEEVIVEPYEGYSDSRGRDANYRGQDYVNVYYWPAVQYILGPQYRVYASPYYWSYYPTWWSPWRPYLWNDYRPRIVVYHTHYHIVNVHRVVQVHNFYRPYRTYSHTVVERTNQVRVNHGKAPVNRPAVQENRTRGDYQRQDNQVEQPRVTSPRSNTTGGAIPRTSTDRTTTTRPNNPRATTTQPDVTRTTTTRSNTTSTPTARPNTSRTTTARPDATRTTTARPSTSSAPVARPGTTRTTPQAQRPPASRNSTAAPAARSTTTKKSGSTSRKGNGG